MIPIFRKLRKQMAADNRPMQYLRYAIGEIVLVVIGILIALQINNWNEVQKVKAKTRTVFIEILKDLDKDILQVNENIDHLEEKDSLLDRVLSKVVTAKEILSMGKYRSLITSYTTTTINTKGYESLMELTSNLPDDSYRDEIEQIKSLYEVTKINLDRSGNAVASFSKKTMEKYSDNYAWFSAYENPQKEEIAFFLNNPFYLNDAYTYRIYSTGNYLRDLYVFKYDAALCYQAIHKTLALTDTLPKYIGFVLPTQPKVWNKFLGHYKMEGTNQDKRVEFKQMDNNMYESSGSRFLMISENTFISMYGKRKTYVFELDENHTAKGFNVLKNKVIIQHWKKYEEIK
ncbi:MAG TPA: DUF6090 family protein [Prolixibacteraceae bacterium]|jgi:hypothetical protein